MTEKERSRYRSWVSSLLRWEKLQCIYMMLKEPMEKLMMQEREDVIESIKTLSNWEQIGSKEQKEGPDSGRSFFLQDKRRRWHSDREVYLRRESVRKIFPDRHLWNSSGNCKEISFEGEEIRDGILYLERMIDVRVCHWRNWKRHPTKGWLRDPRSLAEMRGSIFLVWCLYSLSGDWAQEG